MRIPRLILADGVVAAGSAATDRVLSARDGDTVCVGDLGPPLYDLWGEWHQDAVPEVRLSLHSEDAQLLEGDADSEPAFYATAGRLLRRRRSLSKPLRILFFQFGAAHAHLRGLLLDYARLTSVIGPRINFDPSPVVRIDYLEPYAHFDAFLASLCSFADSVRFLVWSTLRKGSGVPRNLRTLVGSSIPIELRSVIERYLDSVLNEAIEYRDNAVHYAPPGAHMPPYLLWSKKVIHAQVWLPRNPRARSLTAFRYDQKDAFKYARSLLEGTYSFCDRLFPVLDLLQRESLRAARQRRSTRARNT